VDVAVGEDLFLDLSNLDASLRYQLTLPITERVDITVGTRLTLERISVNVRAPRPPTNGGVIAPIGGSDLLEDEEVRWVVDNAIYFEAKWRPTDAIQIVPGLRLDYFGLVRNATLDPRLLVRWKVNDVLTLKTAAGLYHKAPEPQELSSSFGNPAMGPEQAVHLVMGGEVALPIGVMIDVTLFYKWLDDLVLSEPAGESLEAVTTNAGEGQALGLEVMIKFRPTKWLMGWVSYTLSRSSRTLYYGDEVVVRPFQYDHTHVVTALARVEFGKGWSLGVRWNLHSGAPYSRSPGGYLDVDADLYGPLGGDPNAERIPAFHQLDIRLDKKFTFNWLTLELYLEVMNVYNRSNREQPLYSFDYREQDFFRGLPIIPSFGIAGKF
jgi:outer membrane receptor protein involved in Fe transport